MKKRMFIGLLAAAVVLSAVSALAQANTGDVKGRVLDEKSQPISSAVVRFTGPDGKKSEVKTNKEGEFAKTGLAAGKYKIELMVEGQRRWGGEYTVVADQPNQVKIDLAAEAAAAKMSAEQRKKVEQEAEEQRKKIEAERAKLKNLNAMLSQGKQMMDAGDYDGATGIYENAVQADPSRDLLWANLGSAYLAKAAKTKDKAETTAVANKAVEALQKAIGIKPNDAAYHNNLGQAYSRAGNTAEALNQFRTAAQMDPTAAARYYFNAGAILTNESTKLAPNSPEQRTKLDEANDMFRKSIAADPKYSDGEAYYQIATNLLGQATVAKDGKMVVPDGTADAYQKYLAGSPNGRFAESAKQTLAALGSTVETTYKQRSGGKKK